MNTSQTVARLEALLARVRKRAAEPRAAPTATILADASPPPPPPPAPMPAARAPEPPPPPMPPQRTEADIVVEVEVAETTQDTIVAVAAEEVVAPAALESRERLVAAEPLVAEAPAADAAPTMAPPREAEPEAAPAEVSEEDIEEAPASSRRPVGPQPEERLAEMAFGAEEPSPPRHTPPPESGRLPAAPPVEEFDVDNTGVREAAKTAARQPEPIPEARAAPAEPSPVSVRGDIAPSSAVADVVGHSERAMPTRFVELLDASLAL